MNPDHYFTCPRCGGHYFGMVEGIVYCHGSGSAEPGGEKYRHCGWRGVWPEESE